MRSHGGHVVLRTHNVMRSRFTTFFMGYQVQTISRMDTSRYAHAHTHTHTHTELYIHISSHTHFQDDLACQVVCLDSGRVQLNLQSQSRLGIRDFGAHLLSTLLSTPPPLHPQLNHCLSIVIIQLSHTLRPRQLMFAEFCPRPDLNPFVFLG